MSCCQPTCVFRLEKAHVNEKGQLLVPDLLTALKVAKKGDVIYLCAGEHDLRAQRPKDVDYTAVDKEVTIIGAHSSRCVVIGTLLKNQPGRLIFRRLKLVLAPTHPNPNVSFGLFIRQGNVVFYDCMIVCHGVANAIGLCGRTRAEVATKQKLSLECSPPTLEVKHSRIVSSEGFKRQNFLCLIVSSAAFVSFE